VIYCAAKVEVAMKSEQSAHDKAAADIREAEEFLSAPTQAALVALSSILGRPKVPDCGHRRKRTPTLEEYDKWQ
jgi:hypothetical protein